MSRGCTFRQLIVLVSLFIFEGSVLPLKTNQFQKPITPMKPKSQYLIAFMSRPMIVQFHRHLCCHSTVPTLTCQEHKLLSRFRRLAILKRAESAARCHTWFGKCSSKRACGLAEITGEEAELSSTRTEACSEARVSG